MSILVLRIETGRYFFIFWVFKVYMFNLEQIIAPQYPYPVHKDIKWYGIN